MDFLKTPQRNPSDIQKDSTVNLLSPEKDNTRRTKPMPEVYCIKGSSFNEFTPVLPNATGKNKHKTSKAFLAHRNYSVTDFPIGMFSKWSEGLKLGTELPRLEAESAFRSQFRLICLYPTKQFTDKVEQKNKFEWAIDLALKFYCSYYNNHTDDEVCIKNSLNVDRTFMIVMVSAPKNGDKVLPNLSQNKVKVISAITFREGKEADIGSALICWLMVIDKFSDMPSGLSSWRRLGFGRFMLVMVIKCLTMDAVVPKTKASSCNQPIPGVDLYLQATEEAAKEFYKACGFSKINDKESSGFELLPESIAQTLEPEGKEGTCWIYPESNDVMFIDLLCLRSGELQFSVRKENEEDQPSLPPSEFYWCRYPIPRWESTSIRLPLVDVDNAQKGLPLIDKLYPLSSSNAPNQNVDERHNKLAGYMTSDRRLKHSIGRGKSPTLGTEWMESGELEMMTALITRNERYKEHAIIIPFSIMQMIPSAFAAYVNMVNGAESGHHTKIQMNKLIQFYEEHMNHH